MSLRRADWPWRLRLRPHARWTGWLVGLSLLVATAAAARPPNIVLILADDLGWPYVGFMGDPVAITPNLDALAAQGMVFRNAHMSASVCGPSHRTLLAGLDLRTWERTRLALVSMIGPIPFREEVPNYRTLPRELQRVGYESWEGGKMWEGSFAQAGFTHGLATRVPPGCPLACAEGDSFGRDGIGAFQDFLDEVGDWPFFAWVAPTLPHAPLDAPQQYRDPYEQMGRPENEVEYYANVSWLDAVVGDVLAELDRRGLRDDTLVVLVSDNGAGLEQVAFHSIFGNAGRGKGSLYELGFRTPLVFRWPGHVPAGVVRDDLVAGQDVFATLLDYAGAAPLLDRHGASLKPAIESGTPFPRDRIVVYQNGIDTLQPNTGHVVRTREWRYLRFERPFGGLIREELYRIALDPFEQHDVAATHAGLLQAFRADVLAWEAAIATAPASLEVAGRLVSLDGEPIAGARLRLADGQALAWAQSDARGFFGFQGVARGSYQLGGEGVASDLDWYGFGPEVPVSVPVGVLGPYLPVTARVHLTHHLLAGRTLALQRNPLGSRLWLDAVGSGISSGSGDGSVDDPTIAGAVLRLRSRSDHFDVTYFLPPEGWRRMGSKGFAYTAPPGTAGPVTRGLVIPGRLIWADAASDDLGFGLDQNPGPVEAVLTVGTQRYCLGFGGDSVFRAGQSFVAHASAPPASCPI